MGKAGGMSGWRWGEQLQHPPVSSRTRQSRKKKNLPDGQQVTTILLLSTNLRPYHRLSTSLKHPKTRLWNSDGISGFFFHVFLGKNGPSNTPSWAQHLRSRGLVFGASNASKPEAFQPSSTSNTQGGLSCWWFKVSIPKVVERDQSAHRDGSFKKT